MTSAAGVPQARSARPPLTRGRKELLAALLALPVLLAAGFYVGGRISDSGGSSALEPGAGIGSPVATAAPAEPSARASSPAAAPRPSVSARPSPVARTPVAQPPVAQPPVAQPPVARPPVTGPPVGAPAPAAPAPPGVLGRGSAGADVRRWQQQMARRGWRIRVDGIFGPQSERVARRFQQHKGLRVDGLVGPRTWAATWRPVRR